MSFLDREQFLTDLFSDMDSLTLALRVGSVELDEARRFQLGQAAAELAGATLTGLDWPPRNDQPVTP